MSTMQSRSASMVAALETAETRFADLPGVLQGRFEPTSYIGSDEAANSGRIRQSEVSFSPEPAVPPPVPLQGTGLTPQAAPQQTRNVAPVPHITIHAFCENHDVLSVLDMASSDRIMSRTKVDLFAGGIKAATEHYKNNPVPNLIIVERRAPNEVILAELEELAQFCDPGTKVLVIGHSNDILFYRELIRRGVSEYVVAPIGVVPLIAAISGIYRNSESSKLGQVYAFVGAKGGVGSSTIAHNVGWALARSFSSEVVLADLDLPFGTAGLNFNVDSPQGIAEAIQGSNRLDEVLLDRLLTKCDDHFSLLAAPGTLDASYDLDENAFSNLLEVAQANVPFTILDIPHLWTSWARNALVSADEIVITAMPDLANLRNTKNLIEFLKRARPNDTPPKLVLNQVGMAKRPEIKPNEFARTLQIEPIACVPFDAQLFGMAANNGKMIADTSAKSPTAQNFADIAARISGRKEHKEEKKLLHKLRTMVNLKKL